MMILMPELYFDGGTHTIRNFSQLQLEQECEAQVM